MSLGEAEPRCELEQWLRGAAPAVDESLDGFADGWVAAGVLGCGTAGLPERGGGLDLLEEQFLASMNALAAAEAAPEVTGCQIQIHRWRDGYDQPAFSSQARYAGWTILAASPAPEHSESGCLTFAAPRAGSAGTVMPGLPWGRQFLLTPIPGAHAVVPGWLTCSVVPLEHHQHLTVAAAVCVG